MGTRSTTKVLDQDGKVLVNMYGQFDGYEDGHGLGLARFLASKEICNGINSQTMETHANGEQCLAAQLIAHFKTKIGGIYLAPSDQEEEYDYTVFVNADKIRMTCKGYETDFKGSPQEFIAKYSEKES